jgi:hypothetical protein
MDDRLHRVDLRVAEKGIKPAATTTAATLPVMNSAPLAIPAWL